MLGGLYLPISKPLRPPSGLSVLQPHPSDYSYGFVFIYGYSVRLVEAYLDRQFPQRPRPFVGR